MRPLSLKLWRDISRQKAQFAAVAVTVFLGVAIFAATYDSYQNLTASYDATATEFRFANLTMQGGDVQAFATTASGIDGVETVQLRTVADLPMQVGDVKFLGRVVGMPDGADVNLVSNAADPSGPAGATGSGVLAEQHMADHFGLSAGSAITVAGTRLEVSGVVTSPEYIWTAKSRQQIFSSGDDFGVVFVSEAQAETLAGIGPNQAVVYFNGGEADAALEESLSSAARGDGATAVFTRAEQPSNAALEEDLRGFEEMALFFPILFLVAAGMAAYVMISRLVWAQRPQIGVLLANGFRKRRVLRHYLGYGLIPGLIGALPGAILGVLLGRLITGMYTGMLAIPVTVVRFYPATLVVGLAFGLVAAALAALAPALFASRVQPAEAMRGGTPPGGGKASLFERLIPPLRRTPIRWRMALRGVGRNRRRTIYTMLGVVLSLTLVLVSWGMIDTVERVLDLQFVQIQREDASVYFSGPVGDDQITLLQGVDGVAAVEPETQLPVTVSYGGNTYDTVLNVLPSDTTMHRFLLDDGSWATLPTDGVLAGSGVGGVLDAAAGDTVTLSASQVSVQLSVPLAGLLDEPLGSMVYASREYVQAQVGAAPATAALIRYDAGADPASVRDAVTELSSVSAFEDAKAVYSTVRQYMVLFYAFVGIMLVFGGAMAFALIFNSMTVNIAERRREVATLLAVGMRRRTISRLITVENMLVAAAAVPIGLVVGTWVSSQAMATFNSDLFTWHLYVRPTTYLFSAVAILLVALLSAVPGLRALRRISIPEVIKERST